MNWMVGLFVLVVAYGSLAPFDFRADLPGARGRLSDALDQWTLGEGAGGREKPGLGIGRREFVLNIVFYAPLGMLVAWQRRSRGRRSIHVTMFAAVIVAATLSVCMEWGQCFLPGRSPSVQDVIANAGGGLVGGAFGVWLLTTRRGWSVARSTSTALDRPASVAAVLFAGFLLADALDPLFPVLYLGHLLRNLRASHFGLPGGLTEHSWHYWLIRGIGVYALFTAVVRAAIGSDVRRAWSKAALLTSCFAFATEACRPFFDNHIINVAVPVAASLGAVCAMILGSLMAGRLSQRCRLGLVISLLVFYAGYQEWQPFTFAWDPGGTETTLADRDGRFLLCESAANGSIAISRPWLHVVPIAGAISCISCIMIRRFSGGRWIINAAKSCLLVGILGSLLEAGQLLIPHRNPSFAYVLLFAGSAIAGVLVERGMGPQGNGVAQSDTDGDEQR